MSRQLPQDWKPWQVDPPDEDEDVKTDDGPKTEPGRGGKPDPTQKS